MREKVCLLRSLMLNYPPNHASCTCAATSQTSLWGWNVKPSSIPAVSTPGAPENSEARRASPTREPCRESCRVSRCPTRWSAHPREQNSHRKTRRVFLECEPQRRPVVPRREINRKQKPDSSPAPVTLWYFTVTLDLYLCCVFWVS